MDFGVFPDVRNQYSENIPVPARFQPQKLKGTSPGNLWFSAHVSGVDRGMWNVLYLFLNHKQFEELGRSLGSVGWSPAKSIQWVMFTCFQGKIYRKPCIYLQACCFPIETSAQKVWNPCDSKNAMLGDGVAEQDNCLRFPKTIAAIQDGTKKAHPYDLPSGND